MKTRFDQLLKEYQTLMEAPFNPPDANQAVPTAVTPAPPTEPTAGAQPQVPPVPQEKEKSSIGYAVLAQIVLDALKTPTVKHKEDIRFSDNKVRTPQEAYQYLDIIKRNLASDSQTKLKGDMGQGNDVQDLDTSELIYLAQLGLKALFYTRKDENDSQFSDLASIVKVNTENAKETIEKIRNILSGFENE